MRELEPIIICVFPWFLSRWSCLGRGFGGAGSLRSAGMSTMPSLGEARRRLRSYQRHSRSVLLYRFIPTSCSQHRRWIFAKYGSNSRLIDST
jgi:hypothetical protein